MLLDAPETFAPDMETEDESANHHGGGWRTGVVIVVSLMLDGAWVLQKIGRDLPPR
jgi:hypothetical protein